MDQCAAVNLPFSFRQHWDCQKIKVIAFFIPTNHIQSNTYMELCSLFPLWPIRGSNLGHSDIKSIFEWIFDFWISVQQSTYRFHSDYFETAIKIEVWISYSEQDTVLCMPTFFINFFGGPSGDQTWDSQILVPFLDQCAAVDSPFSFRLPWDCQKVEVIAFFYTNQSYPEQDKVLRIIFQCFRPLLT